MEATGYPKDRIHSQTQNDVLLVFYALDAHLIPICMINIRCGIINITDMG